jgi:hypothetical protein
VLKFLHAQGCSWDRSVSAAAEERSNLEILRWLLEHGCSWARSDSLRFAASSGNVETTVWVKRQPGVHCDEFTMYTPAALGFTAVCECLHAEQCLWESVVCDAAARSGHVDTLRWLHEHGCPWDTESVCVLAAESGSLDVMMYLQQEGLMDSPEVLTRMLNRAGEYNHLAAAQWLRQQGAEWPDEFGNPWTGYWFEEVLDWARAVGRTSPAA